MLNGRLYRAAFLPFVFALAIAAFSLTGRPSALHSSLAPDAFEGRPAFAELTSLAGQFPDRRPGGAGDEALASYVARTLRGLKMAGHLGASRSTVKGLEVVRVDAARNLLMLKGAVPGSRNGVVLIRDADRQATL